MLLLAGVAPLQAHFLLPIDAGVEKATYEYGPYGELLRATGEAKDLCNFRWKTRYTDPETEFVYFGVRYYDPDTGRWLSREPLGETVSANLYSYCNGDPINAVDVLGLAEEPFRPWKLLEQFMRESRGAIAGEPLWRNLQFELFSDLPFELAGSIGRGDSGGRTKITEAFGLYLVQTPSAFYILNDKTSGGLFSRESFSDATGGEVRVPWQTLNQFDRGRQFGRIYDIASWVPLAAPTATAASSYLLGNEIADGFLGAAAVGGGIDVALFAAPPVLRRGLGWAVEPAAARWALGRNMGSRALNTAGRVSIPWSYGPTGSALGVTDRFGTITIRPGLNGELLERVLRHESVHRFLSPRTTSLLGEFRADLGIKSYWNSNLVRYLEEALAESYGSRNLLTGLRHPFNPFYRVSPTGLVIEGAGYGGVLGGSIWAGYEVGN